MARILLVDDDQDIRNLGNALLNEAGHEAFAVAGVVAAIEFLQLHSVDAVITDANMPQHTGFDLVRTLKKDPRWCDLTIAMLTGRREKKDIQRAMDLGVHDYIIKPIDPMLFIQKVADLLSRRALKDFPQVRFAALKIAAQAKALCEIELISVSEVGIFFRSQNYFNEGSRIELNTELFEKIGIAPPFLRVQSSVQKAGHWETRVIFIGADDNVLSKIRAWVHSNTTRGRAAA